jgi:hypothetical protein
MYKSGTTFVKKKYGKPCRMQECAQVFKFFYLSPTNQGKLLISAYM